jgi:hypothetical protein
MRSDLAVCHWNENVMRAYTSICTPTVDGTGKEGRKKKKKYVPCTYKYRKNIWVRYMDALYSS